MASYTLVLFSATWTAKFQKTNKLVPFYLNLITYVKNSESGYVWRLSFIGSYRKCVSHFFVNEKLWWVMKVTFQGPRCTLQPASSVRVRRKLVGSLFPSRDEHSSFSPLIIIYIRSHMHRSWKGRLGAHLCHLPFPFQQMGSSPSQCLSLLNVIILAVRQAIYIQRTGATKKRQSRKCSQARAHFEKIKGNGNKDGVSRGAHRSHSL